MKVFLAGVPAGNQAVREHHLKAMGANNRLTTFYYLRQAKITMKKYKGPGKVVHCKREQFDVYIGRTNTMHHYGNPFVVGTHGDAFKCVSNYRRWLTTNAYPHLEPERKAWILSRVKTLKNKRLGCFCTKPPCHGFILLELAEKS